MGKVHRDLQNMSGEMVLTPGGWRSKSNVHFIDPDHHLVSEGKLLKKVHTKTGSIIEEFKETKSTVDKSQGASQVPVSNGWIVNSGWTNNSGNPITYFSTKWIVPPPPATRNNQLIYLFNGLQQSTAGPYILQPVLQWGVSPAGGGEYWSIANWYVGGPANSAFFASSVAVNPGDVLQGVMAMTSGYNNLYSYVSCFAGFPSANLYVNNIEELKWANETLECYGLQEFSDYPDTDLTSFFDIDIRVMNPNPSSPPIHAPIAWTAESFVHDNGQKCVIISDANPGGRVDLYYKS